MECPRKTTQAGPKREKMFLLKLPTPIIEPILTNIGPKPRKLREITLNTGFTVRYTTEMK
jgi:hypothetical protein